MAANPAAARLTEAHRLAQARLGRQVALDVIALWSLLDPADIDATFARWLTAARPIVFAGHRQSAALAANYLTTFKLLEVGTPAVPTLADDLPADKVDTSLLVTGPAALRSSSAAGVALRKASDTARSLSARAAMRHAMSGGRDTIAATVESDSQIIGWARVTSGSACSFCAMLASRGPVYRRGGGVSTTSNITFAAHDGCGCSAEPVYRDNAAWPPNSLRYQAQWDQAKALARDEGIRPDVAFRRLHEGRAA